MKRLLALYNRIPTKVKMLEQAIQACGSESDVADKIRTDSMKQNMSGLPFPPAGNTSDKTLNFVQNYAQDLQAEFIDHRRTKDTLEYVHKQIGLAMETLPPLEAIIVRDHCINGLTYEKIIEKLPETATYSVSRLCTFMGKGVEDMCKMVMLGKREYDTAMRAFNVETPEQKAERDKEYGGENITR